MRNDYIASKQSKDNIRRLLKSARVGGEILILQVRFLIMKILLEHLKHD